MADELKLILPEKPFTIITHSGERVSYGQTIKVYDPQTPNDGPGSENQFL
jgi:hypothetical protein